MSGKVAVITGAAHGIGRAFASYLFEQEKCSLVLADLDFGSLTDFKRELKPLGTGRFIEIFKCDVSRNENVIAMVADLKSRRPDLTDVHYLFNNVGIGDYNTSILFEGSIERVKKLFDINYFSMIYCARAFLPMLIPSDLSAKPDPSQKRYIVLTASIAGIGAADGVYGITKHACVATVECMTREIYSKGLSPYVHCAALCPSFVFTNIQDSTPAILGKPTADDKAAVNVNLKKNRITDASNPDRQLFINNAILPDLVVQITMDSLKKGKVFIHTHDDWTEALCKDRCYSILTGERNRFTRTRKAFAKEVDRSQRLNHKMDLSKL